MSIFIFSLFIQPLIDELQKMCKLDFNTWCADYGTLIGTIPDLVKASFMLKDVGFTVRYHL